MRRVPLLAASLLTLLSALAAPLTAQDSTLPSLRKLIAPPPEIPRTTLQGVPGFVQRIFLPLLPNRENHFRIAGMAVEKIASIPAGFSASRKGDGLIIISPEGEASGYLKIVAGGRELTLTLVNAVPFSEVRNGWLGGYRIGTYRQAPLKGLSSYRSPLGFVKLNGQTRDLWVSDHYRMSDFQCKLDGASKYLIIRTEALLKLELMQRELAATGARVTRFRIMSGFRTPYYNSLIGNESSYSRHLYGDAMDIYVDENGDDNMDDINRDGRVDRNDALYLLRIAEKIDRSKEWGWLQGGAGVYKANSSHGPYLHIDTRGYVARWGV